MNKMKGLTIHQPKKERTLKESEKNRLIREKKRKCQRCHNQFPVYCLEIHHKKPVHTYRDGANLFNILSQQPKRRPAYDWKKNLMVVCANCHKKLHYQLSEEKKERKKRQEKKEQPPIFGGGMDGFKPPKDIFKQPKPPKGDLFGGVDIFSSGGGKRKKQPPIFGGFDVMDGRRKKKGGRKDSFDFGF